MDKLINGAARLGIVLHLSQQIQFHNYYTELIAWNQRINLTAVTACEEVQVRHFLDSLTVVLASPDIKGKKVIDIGTGAGFPGLPLKIAFPEIDLTLLEATGKKTVFLKELTGKLGLKSVQIVTGRAEELAHRTDFREHFDLVLARAVAPLPALTEITLPFATINGKVIAMKANAEDEMNSAVKAILVLGGKISSIKEVELEELPEGRVLIVIDKETMTPEAYPRRPGIPNKRPLR